MKQSNLYMYHLDNLRRSRNVTVESFCDGIYSDRHYRRLLSGEQNVSDEKIYDFCNKLGISTKDFYYSANEKDRYEYAKIVKLYHYLRDNKIDDFVCELKKVKKERLVNIQNTRFLDYCVAKYQYMTNKISNKECLEELSRICNYPKNKNYKSFDFVDIISLAIIAEIEVKFEKKEALNLLSKILTEGKLIYISSESRNILPSIYGIVSILLSRLSKYDQAYFVAKKGVDYSNGQSNSGTLTHLYYVLSYTSLKMNRIKQSEIFAVKSLANAISRGNITEYEITYKLIEKNLGISPISLFSIYRDDLFD